MNTLLRDLNDVQRSAVTAVDGPVMIVAGAGSGKTRVLTYRVAHLLDTGVAPQHVLALTFTNKAAREMRERIEALVPGEHAQRLWMGTFHATFARLLRRDADKLGFHRNFTIYDSDDVQNVIRAVMQDLNINTQQIAPAAVRHAISRAKNRLRTPDDVANAAKELFDEKVARVYAEYQRRLLASNAMDFDDLITHPIRLFDEHPELLAQYQQLFRYILIDEYQDTNQAQFQIIRRLASAHRNICVVGDDAQSIYAFRGADIANILSFETHFPQARTFRLEQNYRSTKSILQAAGSVIARNPRQLPKTLWTDNEQGEAVTVIETADEQEEAQRIVALMQDESRRRKLQLKDFAVLYRTNAQSRALEDALRRSAIPYTIIGGVEFYRRREIKDVLAYLRLIVNARDDDALLRVINYPARGIGATTVDRLRAYAIEQGVSLFEAALNAGSIPWSTAAPLRRIGEFVQLIRKYSSLRAEISAGELAGSLVNELGIIAELKSDGSVEARGRLDNIQELLAALSAFSSPNGVPTLEAFLAEASLVADVDRLDPDRNTVTLMTLHAAKGLEFPVVFLTGLEEGLFPSTQAMDNDEVDEERRLCYVGMTRAMQKLYMTHAVTRLRWNERQQQLPSRFLEEIDESVLRRESTRRRAPHARRDRAPYGQTSFDGDGFERSGPPRPASARRGTASGGAASRGGSAAGGGTASGARRGQPRGASSSEYSQLAGDDSYSQLEVAVTPGTLVLHPTFGRGSILSLHGAGDQAKAVVLFESVGKKTLVLKYAGLKILG